MTKEVTLSLLLNNQLFFFIKCNSSLWWEKFWIQEDGLIPREAREGETWNAQVFLILTLPEARLEAPGGEQKLVKGSSCSRGFAQIAQGPVLLWLKAGSCPYWLGLRFVSVCGHSNAAGESQGKPIQGKNPSGEPMPFRIQGTRAQLFSQPKRQRVFRDTG